jgi:DNA-binding transcriptional LysR family regulator
MTVRAPRDIGGRTVIAFSAGCSYRRRLEEWLGSASVVPSQVMEFASYHAIIACVAAGAGVAVVPRSVLALAKAERHLSTSRLPSRTAKARTLLAWREGHQSIALEALRGQLRK